jgi:hypothetical protein
MRSPFDRPDYAIAPERQYRLHSDAEPRNPALPDLVRVVALPPSTVEFVDVVHPTSVHTLTRHDFWDSYDPAV